MSGPGHARPVVSVLSVTVFTLATAVIAGWILNLPVLKSLVPGAVTIKVNTALAFTLAAFSLGFTHHARGPLRRAVVVASVVQGTFAAVILFEYGLRINLGLDQAVLSDNEGLFHYLPPGRSGPLTAVCLFMLAIASLTRPWPRGHATVRLSAGVVLLAALQSCVGFLFGLTYLAGTAYSIQMPLHTAIGMILLATGHLLGPKAVGAIDANEPRTITNLIRVMTLTAAVVPITVRWASQTGLERGLYDTDFARLIEVVGGTILLVALIFIAGTALRKSDVRRLRKTNQLRERNEEFKALVSTITQSVWYKAPTGELSQKSETWSAYTGQDAERSLGWGWLDMVHPDDRARVRDAWAAAQVEERAYDTEYRVRHAEGDFRWTLARARPLFNDHARLRGWIGINFDIDGRKRTEIIQAEARRAAELALVEVRRANELKSAFLANMSHEIRTPLGAILGFAEICQENAVDSDDLRHHLGIIRRNATQLTTLINEILDLSRIEAGHEAVTLAPTDVIELVREVVADVSILAAKKNLALTFTAAPERASPVRTDSQRIKQILTNVIANSIKFTDQGRVSVEVTAAENSELALTIRVADTGIGIPAEYFERIFENFTQVDSSETRRHGGTGLGLTLSRKLARLLGGDLVLIESERNVGSCFAIHVRDNVTA